MYRFFEDFLNDLESVGSDKAARTYRSLLSTFQSWLSENDISATEFNRSDVRSFLGRQGWANSTKNTYLQALKSWASYYEDEVPVGKTLEGMQEARQEEKRLRSLQKMKRYETEEKDVETLEPEKLQYLLEASEPRKGCLFYFYFYTGFRLRELKRIQEIDWENAPGSAGVLTVLTEKRNRKRRVPFHNRAGRVIDRIFSEDWNELNPDTIGSYFREKQPAFDINLTTHTARRTFRTEMKGQGVEKIVVKKLLGHKVRDVTDASYLSVDFDDLTKAMRQNHYFNEIRVPYRRLTV